MTQSAKFSKIWVDSIVESQYKNALQAMLKQKVTTTKVYPKNKLGSSLDATIFEEEPGAEFSNDSTRVYFLKLPVGMETKEQVEAHLAKFPNLHLVRTLSYSPILSNEDISMMEKGDLKMEDKARSQAIRDENNNLILHQGKVQYKRICLSLEYTEDIDKRKSEDVYLPKFLEDEIASYKTEVTTAQ